jgi:hypothetical protein
MSSYAVESDVESKFGRFSVVLDYQPLHFTIWATVAVIFQSFYVDFMISGWNWLDSMSDVDLWATSERFSCSMLWKPNRFTKLFWLLRGPSSNKVRNGDLGIYGVNRRKDEGTPFLLFSLPTHENKTAKQSTQADNSVSLTSKFYIRLLYEDRKGFFVQCSAVSGSEQS